MMLGKIFILLIKGYQKLISPWLGSGKCRFTPTCSEYAMEAFHKYPFYRAFFMSVWRILRCNPLSKGGYDPVK